ncbi:hypothetical protein KP509_35G028300 [Ceratopteris richardii]|uniref:Uncharacterized protein n=1 Tax=Ceratopteris richardii TaxID=49495 RepID=A0A8T2QFH7_CERRI|nr:hypothetical protein KP509_35G028300 [Ceratopteris richardii]
MSLLPQKQLHWPQRCCKSRNSRIFICLIVAVPHLFPVVRAHGGDADSHSDSETVDLRAKSLILTKIYCLIIIFFATFFAGISPYFLRWNHGFLVLGTQFAGGIFLGTSMLHFLRDANATFETLTEKDYPFAFMLACSGYLMTMYADLIIQSFLKGGNNSCNVEFEMATPNGVVLPVTGTPDLKSDRDESHESKNAVGAALVTQSSLSDTILLIFALCFHSVFEGIAIGVAATKADAWRALWTISLHKVFAAIAMGTALLRLIPERPLLQTVLYSFVFGISSPVGVAIGIIIDSATQGRVADWSYAIAMGIASGIFIYVSINHLIAKGYIPQCRVRVNTPLMRLLAVTLGIAVMAVVMIWD